MYDHEAKLTTCTKNTKICMENKVYNVQKIANLTLPLIEREFEIGIRCGVLNSDVRHAFNGASQFRDSRHRSSVEKWDIANYTGWIGSRRVASLTLALMMQDRYRRARLAPTRTAMEVEDARSGTG